MSNMLLNMVSQMSGVGFTVTGALNIRILFQSCGGPNKSG